MKNYIFAFKVDYNLSNFVVNVIGPLFRVRDAESRLI